MYKKTQSRPSSLKVNEGTEGETLETKIERITVNKEPVTDGAPLIYTERKDGVMAGYDIRTDRFDVAIDAMDKVTKTHIASREARLEERKEALKELNESKKKNAESEPIQGTSDNQTNS